MCGILGIVSAGEWVDPAAVRAGLDVQAHRGPDGDGVWVRPGGAAPFVALGHLRLAIIDLSDAAAQPMESDGGSLVITYNGEIYNYLELMAELEARGHRFRSRSDTEVILAAYGEWGAGCLAHLNGMFAFAIWDERRRELFAARDRFGEKPFHYIWDEGAGRFAFSSEIKGLLALPGVEAETDDRALFRFVAYQELAGSEQTLWRGVRRLPNAHWLRVRWSGGASRSLELATGRYWDIDLDRTESMTRDEAARRFAELFEDGVRLRLRSDVPVGSSLSGGLDSSAVVCQIHALGAAGGQKTFSARMEDPTLDEGEYIAAVAEQTGIEGHEVWPHAGELETLFPRLCYHLEEPFIQTSQFAQHLVMRLASEHGVTVLLDGQGADEMLAGYTPYFSAWYGHLADRWALGALWRERAGFRARHSRPFPLTMRMLLGRMFGPIAGRRRDGAALRGGAPAAAWAEMGSWWNGEWLAEFRDDAPPELPRSKRDGLTRKLYADTMCGELQELLRYGDRNSMAWSRELRQPFLDHRLAELLFALPPEYKLDRGETKVVLRRAVRDLIPPRVLNRQDKLGFQAPLPSWLGGDLRTWAEGQLDQAVGDFGGRLAPDARERFGREASGLDERRARAVFSILTLGESRRRLRACAVAESCR
jgi:asparagine synthase (glutamine-hydrolysing)